ncbi:hypothetical protein GOODEAATRI_020529 [Goodea atripinnis]|uniref:Uncharacterized protein n=1 Tax=Goodea atripinnis TaxID=208336 RepID=A0ABV0MTQ8_9TELE
MPSPFSICRLLQLESQLTPFVPLALTPSFSPLPYTFLTPYPSPLLSQRGTPSSTSSYLLPSLLLLYSFHKPITSTPESSPHLSTSLRCSSCIHCLPTASLSLTVSSPAASPQLRLPCAGCSLGERSVVWLFFSVLPLSNYHAMTADHTVFQCFLCRLPKGQI